MSLQEYIGHFREINRAFNEYADKETTYSTRDKIVTKKLLDLNLELTKILFSIAFHNPTATYDDKLLSEIVKQKVGEVILTGEQLLENNDNSIVALQELQVSLTAFNIESEYE